VIETHSTTKKWDHTHWTDDERERRVGLIRLLVGVLLVLGVAGVTGTLGTVLVVLSVIVMIMLHELGHFLTAKWADMKVTEFFVGFGRRLWSVRKGETEYGVKAAFMLGGYCKIPGMTNLEDIDEVDEERTYRQKSFPRRLSVAVAGSAMHFLLALVLLYVLLVGVGIYGPEPLRKIGEISRLETGPSPAQQAGLRVGDEIVAVDGRPLQSWDDIPPYIRSHPGVPVRFEVRRGNQNLVLAPVPVDLSKVHVAGRSGSVSEPTGFVGIGPAFPVERVGPVAGVTRSLGELGTTSKMVFGALGHMFSPHGVAQYGDQLLGRPTKSTGPDDVAPRFLSPVGLVRVAGQAADSGVRTVLYLLISINVFVGIFNMVPLLPLDGGHVAIAVYERIRSRKGRRYQADVAKLMPVFYLALFAIAFLAASSLYLDIVRPLSFQ